MVDENIRTTYIVRHMHYKLLLQFQKLVLIARIRQYHRLKARVLGAWRATKNHS